MSSKNKNRQTARDAIEQYLKTNPGWKEVATITNNTGYTHGHILQTATDMANKSSTSVERQKNFSKPIVAYLFNQNSEVPGSNPKTYIRLIKRYSNNPPASLQSMSLNELQDELRNIADGTVVFEHKVEFRIPQSASNPE